MNNSEFLTTLEKSFLKYIEKGARSNEKLKILHKYIAINIFVNLNTVIHTINGRLGIVSVMPLYIMIMKVSRKKLCMQY